MVISPGLKHILPLLLLPACAWAQPQHGILTGTVRAASGEVIPGIAVILKETGQGNATNESGQFTLVDVCPGVYTLQASGVGYQLYRQTIRVDAGHRHTFDFSLQEQATHLDAVTVTDIRQTDRLTLQGMRVKAPAPLTVITRETIAQLGSRRLDEVLREQTGLAIVHDVGAGARAVGLQVQGFDAAYTMVLLDGQPLVGRNAGNLDLSRITVANIERIEIVKGAASSLFGSEALAGVINIVTRKDIQTPQAAVQLRYGTYQTWDATLQGETPWAGQRGNASVQANYYSTNGFNVNPYLTRGQTAPPYHSLTLQSNSRYKLSPHHRLEASARYTGRMSTNRYAYSTSQFTDQLKEDEWNSTLAWDHTMDKGPHLNTQYYFTRYITRQQVRNEGSQQLLQSNDFSQYRHRVETRMSQNLTSRAELIAGLGGAAERMDNTAYRAALQRENGFGYAQLNGSVAAHWDGHIGLRYDYYTNYGGSLNPSVSLDYAPDKKITLHLSAGQGFKTPDFRQLYQVFTNIQVGYTVIGVEELARTLADMEAEGQVANLNAYAAQLTTLKAETARSYNMGLDYSPYARVTGKVNIFYNDIHNLITTVQVGTRTNGQQIFSYRNIAEAYTTGLETTWTWKPFQTLTLSAGYQLLYAKDRGVIDSIRAGTGAYATIRNPNTGETREATTDDYYGLDNRSRHMFNARVYYLHTPTQTGISCRMNYRGRYGYADANNNYYIDRYDTFVPGYTMVNLSVDKKLFQRRMSVQVTVDNVLDYTSMLMPGVSGRMILAGLSWRFVKSLSPAL